MGAAAPPRVNIAGRLGAILLIVIGGLFLVTSLLGFLPEDRRMSVMGLLLFLVLGLVLGGAGISLLRRLKSGEQSEHQALQEQAVLELMARGSGEVTISEVVRQLALPPADAEAALGRLTDQRMIEPDLSVDGSVVFRMRK